ncbi:MAG: hypothetical protein ACJ8R9_31230 [Steroidobacteraceae bacterium]
MWKPALLIALALALSACAHHRQPKARCAGPLERINVSVPASATDPSPHRQDAPEEESKDEGNES